MRVCVCIYIYVSIHTRTHAHTHIRTHAHANTHTHALSLSRALSLSLSLSLTNTHTYGDELEVLTSESDGSAYNTLGTHQQHIRNTLATQGGLRVLGECLSKILKSQRSIILTI
jgi:hypothetical protein